MVSRIVPFDQGQNRMYLTGRSANKGKARSLLVSTPVIWRSEPGTGAELGFSLINIELRVLRLAESVLAFPEST